MKGLDYLYIDYENVQDIKVDKIKKVANVKIILGQDQNKVPLELVQGTQPLGNAVEWIQVNGKGRNALDFFIAFFLGRDVALNKDKIFIIYSKDTGYDPLIKYLKKNGVKIKRIVSFDELNDNERGIDDLVHKVQYVTGIDVESVGQSFENSFESMEIDLDLLP